ncbi:hypothetical protein ACFL3C_00165 [Patescibacteria group bacterium]
MNVTLNQEINKIKDLISNQRLKEAYTVCNKLLLNFPESGRVYKLQKRIEKTVFKQNVESVKKDLKGLKPLWGEHKYGELVEKLQGLQTYVPGYAPVEKQLEKATKLYSKYSKKERKDTLNKYIKTIGEKMQKEEYEEAITLSKQILHKIPNHEQAAFLLNKAKKLFVDKKINDNKVFLESDKFGEIQEFLLGLLKFNPNSKQINSLLKKARRRETVTLEMGKKEFAFRSYENIIVLYKKKKYDKVIEALQELLAVEPDNLKYLELLSKAKKRFSRQLNREVISKIFKLQKKYKLDHKKHPKEFIRI